LDVSWAGESGVPDLESEFQLKLGEQGEGSRLLSNSYIVCQSNATSQSVLCGLELLLWSHCLKTKLS
jgi:hypothetical protein